MTYAIPKTLVIGAKGFVGCYFYDFYRSFNAETIGTYHFYDKVYAYLRLEDFSLDFLNNYDFEYALIACGIISPKKCEEDPRTSYFINVEQTLRLAKALLTRDIIPILFSSDYVFDGTKTSYQTDSPTCPLNHYGRQKAELEKLASEELSTYCMIRTSKIYGTRKGDGSLFDQMAALLNKNHVVRAATDQILCPIHIKEVIKYVVQLQLEKKTGVYHFTGEEKKSRYTYAKALATAFKKEHLVLPISLDDVSDGVTRPKCVILDSSFPFSSALESIPSLVQQYITYDKLSQVK